MRAQQVRKCRDRFITKDGQPQCDHDVPVVGCLCCAAAYLASAAVLDELAEELTAMIRHCKVK